MDLKCRNCGAELLAGTNFCRQCGAAATAVGGSGPFVGSEGPTTLLDTTDQVATQRMESRPTGDRGRDPVAHTAGSELSDSTPRVKTNKRKSAIGVVIAVFVLAFVLGAVLFLSFRNARITNAGVALIYPGAKTIVDLNGEDGSRALHLETSDTLEQVESWYQTNLKPSKTMRLTSTSVILKNDNATATLASEEKKTSIVIKVRP